MPEQTDSPWVWTRDALEARGRRIDDAIEVAARTASRALAAERTGKRETLTRDLTRLLRRWRAWWQNGDALGMVAWSADAATMEQFEQDYRRVLLTNVGAKVRLPALTSPRSPDLSMGLGQWVKDNGWIILAAGALFVLAKRR